MPKKFENMGFGWSCKTCSTAKSDTESRLLKEGEAESKFPSLSQSGLAEWKDKERTTLICPRCGAVEKLKSID